MIALRAVSAFTILLAVAVLRAQEPIAPAPASMDDPAAVFRYDPIARTMVVTPPAEIKPGYVYNRYSPQLRRRVWSMADEGGGFLFAMAPGSVQAAWQLDIRATAEQQLRELAARAPELAQIMDIRGARAYVRLDENEEWQLVPRVTIANVYDLETLRRYEWHGQRRVSIVHSTGYEWLIVDGKFVAATIGTPGWSVAASSFCR